MKFAFVLFFAISLLTWADNQLPVSKATAPQIVRDAITSQPVHDFRLEGELTLTAADDSRKKYGVIILVRPQEKMTQTILRLTSPPDVAGAALLILQRPDPPHQVYYHPVGSNEAQDVSQGNGSFRFLDTDLAYDDVSFSFLRWARQESLGEEKKVGRNCDVVQSFPSIEDHSPYGRVKSWLDQEYHSLLCAEGYDSGGRLIKSLHVKGFHRFEGGWAIKEMLIEDHLLHHQTKLVVDRGDFHITHPESEFSADHFFRDQNLEKEPTAVR